MQFMNAFLCFSRLCTLSLCLNALCLNSLYLCLANFASLLLFCGQTHVYLCFGGGKHDVASAND
ncbi:hypothetical protein M758_4G238900 [Ceratodon purpureus]|uniref:Uncharacterized protein n=1 Tax=Ceratodon purpureus TaxID=3225 RepID=A0A8T0IFD1_CERPU|nr:hypothetical protein KC19_4G234400 [Ceratodon purpureus]KAG0620733.1 hypothetical protein M758_4G238900 [Ceratodon purpureus]